MHLASVRIRNYRLLVDAELEVDSATTLIVGRNNTAKTSLFSFIKGILEGGPFGFDDYPLWKHKGLCDSVNEYVRGKLSFDDLCASVEPIVAEFRIDYSQEGEEDGLGALSPFIIDVDPEITTALIVVEFGLTRNEKKLRGVLAGGCGDEDGFGDAEEVRDAVRSGFKKLFSLTVYAVNPTKANERQVKDIGELKMLFPSCYIPAERLLGEDGSKSDPLASLITEFFDSSASELGPEVARMMKDLHDVVGSANKEVQGKSDEVLSSLVNEAVGFGYPNAEELQLAVTTRLDFDEQIKNRSLLSYTAEQGGESLPGTHNGLGYKNLIKMEFLLAAFAKSVAKTGDACIPLLFIEEPESHMHPQMQHAFAKYLESFIGRIGNTRIQTFLSSHSAHIANTIPFAQIRYAQKTKDGIVYKNLSTFADKHRDNTDFIMKYLTLTRCDLLFADKAILVEGASERLLLPDVIAKCAAAGDFDGQKYKLTEQYCSLIEVGGAYAYKFLPFVEFLGIPCLVITDLDPVAGPHNKAVSASQGETTSNATIKWWVRKNVGLSEDDSSKIELSSVISMAAEKKTQKQCHIEFQTEEHGLCGRSLEEAIRNVNRAIYGLDNDATEDDLTFGNGSKTDFALDLIYKHDSYTVPAYIRDGLVWLNDQKTIG